jgi:hypothetical protein
VYLGGFEKTSWYAEEFMNYATPNLVSLMGNKEHSVQKRMMSHVYSKSSILSNAQLSSLSTELVYGKLGEVLRGAAERGCDFDAYSLNQAIGADFTSAFLLGMGCCTGFMGDLAAGETFRRRYKVKMKGLSGHEEATRQLESHVLSLCRLAEKTESDAEKGVVHSQLSSQLDRAGYAAQKGVGGDNLIIASEIFDHLIAGIETTRITLTYLQWELSRSPALQSSLRAELRTLSPPINLSDPSTTSSQIPNTQHLPDPKVIDSLPLLNAILKETLRLYPPSPAQLHRVTPPEGAVINGFAIPGGTVVGTSSVGMHQNASVFPNPGAFRPERWLVADDAEKAREMNRWFWAFGSGGRMCIGSHFAIYCEPLPPFSLQNDHFVECPSEVAIETCRGRK